MGVHFPDLPNSTASSVGTSASPSESGWRRRLLDLEAPAGARRAQVYVHGPAGAHGTLDFDDIVFAPISQ